MEAGHVGDADTVLVDAAAITARAVGRLEQRPTQEIVVTAVDTFVRPVTGVPRWAVWLAAFIAMAPLPSFLYRLPMAAGHPMGFSEQFMANLHAPGWGSLYVIALGLLTEGCALLCLGLVRPWGERWPHWTRRRGQPLPTPAAVVPALLGATLLTTFGAGYVYTSVTAQGDGPTGPLMILMHLCYAPMIAWGPALFLLTAHYVRRRGAVHR